MFLIRCIPRQKSRIPTARRIILSPPYCMVDLPDRKLLFLSTSMTEENTFKSTSSSGEHNYNPQSSHGFPPPALYLRISRLADHHTAPLHALSIAPSHPLFVAPSEVECPDIVIIEPRTSPASPTTPSEMYGPEVIRIAPPPAPRGTGGKGSAHWMIEVITPATERAESVVDYHYSAPDHSRGCPTPSLPTSKDSCDTPY
ncbi:hypothetical protein RhiLY_04890 [Ceratobasidium sp. AG-Ba]|nr:hypothetical protein RhiLY_04890 [Ceratobasidium sp. AG-Ba]